MISTVIFYLVVANFLFAFDPILRSKLTAYIVVSSGIVIKIVDNSG